MERERSKGRLLPHLLPVGREPEHIPVPGGGAARPRPSRVVSKVPGAPLRECPLLAGPRRREVAPPPAAPERLPFAGRTAQKVEGGNGFHELVRFRPPSETPGFLGAGRGDTGHAGSERTKRLAVDDGDLDAVAARPGVLVPGRHEACRPEPGP